MGGDGYTSRLIPSLVGGSLVTDCAVSVSSRCDLVRRGVAAVRGRAQHRILVAARMLQGVEWRPAHAGKPGDHPQASFHPRPGTGDRRMVRLRRRHHRHRPLCRRWLVNAASWRWIFLLNLPLLALVVWYAVCHMPERGRRHVGPARLARCALRCRLAGATWALIDRSWVLGVIGVTSLVGCFCPGRVPLPPPDAAAHHLPVRQFTTANVATLLIYGGLGAVLFLIGLVLQESLGYSPIEAGLATLPITVIMLVFSAPSTRVADRLRRPMTRPPGGHGDEHRMARERIVHAEPVVVLVRLEQHLVQAPATATLPSVPRRGQRRSRLACRGRPPRPEARTARRSALDATTRCRSWVHGGIDVAVGTCGLRLRRVL